METVTAVSACGAIVPLLVDVVGGAAIGLIGAIGTVGTVGDIVLATHTSSGTTVCTNGVQRASLVCTAIAVTCFGTYSCLSSKASHGGVAAAFLVEEAVSVACLGTAWAVLNGTASRSRANTSESAFTPTVVDVTFSSGSLKTLRRHVPVIVTATGIATSGLLDLGAGPTFAHGSMAGRLGITATLGALHPVVTTIP